MDFYRIQDFEPDRSLGYLAKRILQASTLGLEPIFAAHDLTYLQWSALVTIRFGRGRTCIGLARDLGHDAGATTRLVDSLEAKGLVVRERSADDRRVVNLSLTPAGDAAALAARADVTAQWNAWLADWDRADVETMLTLMQRLRATLEAAETAA